MTSRHTEELLDEALVETFPASDPISFQNPAHGGPGPHERGDTPPPEERDDPDEP